MRSIEARFKIEELKNPYLGACINLAKAVRGQGFSRKNLVKAFKKCVPPDEYEKSEMSELINNLQCFTNTPEEGENRGKNRSGGTLKVKIDNCLIPGELLYG